MQIANDDQLRDIRKQLLARSAEHDDEVALIERALVRLEAGTYGTCERCGKAIEAERLRVVPYADVCRHCTPDG